MKRKVYRNPKFKDFKIPNNYVAKNAHSQGGAHVDKKRRYELEISDELMSQEVDNYKDYLENMAIYGYAIVRRPKEKDDE